MSVCSFIVKFPRLRLYANAFSKDTVGSNPPVDSTAIVADLKAPAAYRFNEVKIFDTAHPAKDDVSD
jgi:hypothetical protein